MKTKKGRNGPSRRTIPAIPLPLGLGLLIAAIMPCYKKVKFADKKAALKGFSILLKSGGLEAFGENVYGLASARQMKLLKRSRLKFEVLDD